MQSVNLSALDRDGYQVILISFHIAFAEIPRAGFDQALRLVPIFKRIVTITGKKHHETYCMILLSIASHADTEMLILELKETRIHFSSKLCLSF